ncbi:hypothetical protein [Ruania alkalisoli]|nr:hypothetical protein [Ruania alkalisoli]
MSYSPVPIPEHLPDRLPLTLWDFSSFADLDRAFAQVPRRT